MKHNLRALQLAEYEILLEFRRICDRLGLRYYLTAGTLLGAVRHQGFIPWDDDIDVVMPRADFDCFAAACPAELCREYFYQSHRTDPDYPFYFSKLRRNGTQVREPILKRVSKHQGQYIDIFPLDACPSGERGARLFFKGIELLGCAIMSKVNPDFTCGYTKPYMRGLFRLCALLPKRGLFALRGGLRRGVALCSDGSRLCTVDGAHRYPREAYDAAWFQSAVTVQFEAEAFPAPCGWRELLENMYGDYMTPPEESLRQGHFVADNQKERAE